MQNIDVLGHLGGFITGALCGLFLLPGLGDAPSDIQHHKSVKTFSIWSTVIFCITLLACFYTLREPAQTSSALTVDNISITEETMPLDTNADDDGATVEEIGEEDADLDGIE